MLVALVQAKSNNLAHGASSPKQPQRATVVGKAAEINLAAETGPPVRILPLCYPGRTWTLGCLVTRVGDRPRSDSTLYGRWKKPTVIKGRAKAPQLLQEAPALMLDPHPSMEVPSTRKLAPVRGLGLEKKVTVKDHHPLAGEPLRLSLSKLDQDGGTPHSHAAKRRMALPVAGVTLCLKMVPEMEAHHPGVLRKSHPVGTMARRKVSRLTGERAPKAPMDGATVTAATVTPAPMARAQGSGERRRSRRMDRPAACGKEKEVMEEVVDGRRAPGEEIEEEAGVSLLLLRVIAAGGRSLVQTAQCRGAGALPSPRKAAAAAAALAAEEVAAWVHGVVLVL